MHQNRFWELIDSVDVRALDEGDDERAIEPLIDTLSDCAPSEIRGFEESLSHVLYDIDGRAYAQNCPDSGGDDDGFLYARCFVVAKGRGYYTSTKSDPSKMRARTDLWCKPLLSAAAEAWDRSQGSEFDPIETVSHETGSNKALWS